MTPAPAVADVARALSRIDAPPVAVLEALPALELSAGRVTALAGPPGVGKSSLVSSLLQAYASVGGRTGAILADPGSTVTGGSVLGDRVRLGDAALLDGVFVRSVSVGGRAGAGLCAPLMAWALADRGYPHVLLEAVGGGQQDLNVAGNGDILVLVLGPDSGDWVQFIKAGVLELCDVVAVTKSDLGSGHVVTGVQKALALQGFRESAVPVVAVSAETRVGVDELVEAIAGVYERLGPEALERRRREATARVVRQLTLAVVEQRLLEVERAAGGDWRAIAERGNDIMHGIVPGG